MDLSALNNCTISHDDIVHDAELVNAEFYKREYTPDELLKFYIKTSKKYNLYESFNYRSLINNILYGDKLEEQYNITYHYLVRGIYNNVLGNTVYTNKAQVRKDKDYIENRLKTLYGNNPSCSQCNNNGDNNGNNGNNGDDDIVLIGGITNRLDLIRIIESGYLLSLSNIHKLLRISRVELTSNVYGVSAYSILTEKLLGLTNSKKYPTRLKIADKKINNRHCSTIAIGNGKPILDSKKYHKIYWINEMTDRDYEKLKERGIRLIEHEYIDK